MSDPDSDVAAQFRVSPAPVLAMLPLLGLVFYALGDAWFGARELFRFVLFALLMYLLAAVGWLVYRRQAEAGRWFAVLSAAAAVLLAHFWLGVPGALAMAAAPAAAAIGVLGLGAAAAIAVGQSALLLSLSSAAAIDAQAVALPLIALWTTFGALAAVHLSTRQATQWSWEYFVRARDLVEQARDRQAELASALDQLAHANQQLTRLNLLADGLRRAADDARLAKEQFVANVSHELRTPLNMIIGFSEMILESPETYGASVPPALLADLTVIRRNAQHLAELIDDVLDLSQIEADQMALTKEPAVLSEIVEAAVEAVRPLFESRHLRLAAEAPDNLPDVHCDRTRIREALLNLLSNAGRFTEHGGVQVRVQQDGEDVVVSVSDTGPGIAAEHLDRLFQPFQQVDGSIRRRYGGTGLGLSISKRFIEQHGGRIWVESQQGAGTTFFFRLPIGADRPGSASSARWLVPDWEFHQRTDASPTVKTPVRARLVVLEAGNSLKRLLKRYAGDVDIAAVDDLADALHELSAGLTQALLINDASPSETLDRLDAATLPYGVPVVACSVPGADESAHALGVAGYLVKPISKEALLAALDRLNLRAGTLLIVDDEPDALRLLQRMLHSSGRGYRVLRARDGQEALKLLGQYRPDVILLDLVMPNMDGFQLLRIRSQDARLQGIPVIVISARDPLGQPIVSRALAVTRRGGLSVHALLSCIRAITQVLAVPGPATEELRGQQAPA